jgi:hypothetical protein
MCRWVLELAEDALPEGAKLIPESIQYNENENKPARDYFWSILEHRAQYEGVIEFLESFTTDDWVRNMIFRVKQWTNLYDPSKDGPGWFMPLVLAVDSLVGTAPEDMVDKVLKAGDVDLGFPVLARKLTALSQLLPQLMGRRPMWLIATNHLKRSPNPRTGQPEDTVPGGQAIKHMESLEFRFSRVKDYEDSRLTGAFVKIKFHKNCFGNSRRVITVPIFWCYDVDPTFGAKRQWTMWDWPTASILFLEAIKDTKPRLWSKIEPILDLQVSNGRVRSEALGISGTSRLSRHEAGLVLESNGQLMDQLLPILGINQGRFFRPGTDYNTERMREDVMFDSMSLRRVRRPAAGNLTKFIAERDVDGHDAEFIFDAENQY